STSRQVGSALGIAIIGTVLFSGAGTILDSSLADRGLPEAQRTPIVHSVVESSGAAIHQLDSSERTAPIAHDARIAFSDATKIAGYSAAGFLAFGFLATLSLGGARRDAASRTE